MRWGQGIMARIVLVGALCLALTLAASAGAQGFDKKRSIDIPAQALTPALVELFKDSGIDYGYSPDTSEQEETRVGPVRGQYTIEEALTLLLRSTGLTFTRVNSKTIAIFKALPPKVVAPPPQVNVPPPPPPKPKAAPAERSAGDQILDEVIIERSKLKSSLRHQPQVSSSSARRSSARAPRRSWVC